MPKVYVSMICDLLHAGHIRVLQHASTLGDVTLGLLTSPAIHELNDVAYLKYSQRLEVLRSVNYINRIVPQNTASYRENLYKYKPDFVVHGDDWNSGPHQIYRDEVLNILREWGGQLVEIPYSNDISDVHLKEHLIRLGITGCSRQAKLKQLLQYKPTLKILEAHNAISAIIAENSIYTESEHKYEFDGMWSSSLTDSTAKGKPDIEVVDLTSRLNVINEIFDVTSKPLIFDADTGGKHEHFELSIRTLERTGISAVVIEDKVGLKKNSLLGNSVAQYQDTIESFCHKIQLGKSSQQSDDLMIIARIESLILEAGMSDALKRAHSYVEAGADGIMIHSRRTSVNEISEFMSLFRKDNKTTPVAVVPTSFNHVTSDEFQQMGVNIIIYANHMLRAAYPAMQQVALEILRNRRSYEAEKYCMSINDILNFIPGTI